MTKYIIYSKNITNGFQEELARQEFEELSKSKEILGEVFAKEKIYNIILMNYYEFEKELFEIVNKVMESENSFADREREILEELNQVRMYAPELATLLEADVDAMKEKLGLEKAKLQNVTRRELIAKAREMKIHFDRKMR